MFAVVYFKRMFFLYPLEICYQFRIKDLLPFSRQPLNMGNMMGKAMEENFNKNKKFMIELQSIQVSNERFVS